MSTSFNTPVMTVTTSRDGDIVVVHVAGELDMYSVDPFADAVRDELATRPAGLVIDLLEVGFCGTSGLRVLAQARHDAAARSTGLCVVATNPSVLRPLHYSGMTELFQMHETVPDAIKELVA